MEDRVDADHIDYQRLLQEALRDALRGAVRKVLARVAEEGLPGEHFFYIGFRIDHPGVSVPRFLRDQYPEEMTIVLQNQYWDLEVDEESFSVTLTFGGARQRLIIPFYALTAFADPSAEFGLRFDGAFEAVPVVGTATPTPAPAPAKPRKRPERLDRPDRPETSAGRSGEVVPFDPSRRK